MDTLSKPCSSSSFPATRPIPTLRWLVGLGIGLALCSLAAAQTDLAPASVVGPGTTYTDAATIVTVNVANLGDPLGGNYTIEVLLSADGVIDAGDLVAATVSASTLGYVHVPVTLPLAAPTGLLTWAARISGVAGEIATANNQVIGTQGYVQTLDLTLDDPSPIKFFVRTNETKKMATEVSVVNAGSADSVLVFSIEPQSPAAWLEVTPPSSFAVGGQGGQPIELTAHYEGMLPGVYATTLRFQSFTHPNDFEELPVELEIGDPKFIPGDRLLGQVATPGDADEMKFDGIEGLRLILKMGVKSGNLKPRVEVVDPLGAVETTLDFSNQKTVTKIAKLKASGEYTLRVLAADGASTGGWFVKTNRKLPKKGEARVVTVNNPGGTADVEVRLLPLATLDFAIHPGNQFAGPVALGFTTPLGASLDILANTVQTGSDVRVEDVETLDVGSYWIQVDGFGANANAKAKVKVLPVQPKRGKTKVYVP